LGIGVRRGALPICFFFFFFFFLDSKLSLIDFTMAI